MDTSNKYLVSVTGANEIVMLNPSRGPMSPDDALVLAAWLVSLAGYNSSTIFDAVLVDVRCS